MMSDHAYKKRLKRLLSTQMAYAKLLPVNLNMSIHQIVCVFNAIALFQKLNHDFFHLTLPLAHAMNVMVLALFMNGHGRRTTYSFSDTNWFSIKWCAVYFR